MKIGWLVLASHRKPTRSPAGSSRTDAGLHMGGSMLLHLRLALFDTLLGLGLSATCAGAITELYQRRAAVFV